MRLTFRKTVRVCLLAGGVAAPMVPPSIQAQQPGQPTTPGLPATHALPGQLTTEQFIPHPDQLLAKFPNGGAEMIAQVRELTLANHANLPYLLEVLARANHEQGIAIGTGLGQAALASVKTDQAYSTAIQQAVADKGLGWAAGAGSNVGGGSDQPKIGSTVTTVNEVEGETEKGVQTITTGTAVYAEEQVRTGSTGKAQLLFADRTNLAVAPMTTIRLDKYVYDPNGGGQGNVVLVATEGSFRFITGILPHEDYSIKTPYATMGIRGTEFIVVICNRVAAQNSGCGLQTQVTSGEVVLTTNSGQVVTLTAGQQVSVNAQGVPSTPTQSSQPIANFADLGPPITNVSYADALDAFSAVTGGVSTGATGAGGGGGGGGGGGVTSAVASPSGSGSAPVSGH
jgi:FecR protein